MYWLIKKLTKLLSRQKRELLAYEIVRDEQIGSLLAEKIITEVIKDQNNKIISFVVRD